MVMSYAETELETSTFGMLWARKVDMQETKIQMISKFSDQDFQETTHGYGRLLPRIVILLWRFSFFHPPLLFSSSFFFSYGGFKVGLEQYSQWFVNVCSSQDLPFQMDLSQEMISEMECNVASIQSNIELFPSSPTAYKIHWSICTNTFGCVQVMRKHRPKLHLHYISILRLQTVLQVNWKINS